MNQYLYWKFSNAISKEQINLFLDEQSDRFLRPGLVNKNSEIKEIRAVSKIDVSEFNTLALMLFALGIKANRNYWNYEIENSYQCEFLQYDGKNKGHYKGHIDSLILDNKFERKLTVIGILNNNFSGGDFYIQVDGNQKNYIDLDVGDVVVFPSFYLHGVEEVDLGIRKSCVTWLYGPFFN